MGILVRSLTTIVKRVHLVLALVTLMFSACAVRTEPLPTSATAPPSSTAAAPPAVVTHTSGPATVQPFPTQVVITIVTPENSAAPSPTPAPRTAIPTSTPEAPATPTLPPPLAQISPPVGLAVYSWSNATLTLYDRKGQGLATMGVPAMSGRVHLVGGLGQGAAAVPVVYVDHEKGALQLVSEAGISTLGPAPNVVSLVGAPGVGALAYCQVEYGESGILSHLYVGTPQSLPTATPALSRLNTEGWAIVPLAVRAQAGEPVGVWVTHEPQGIGGEIVFPPREGLCYLDLASGAEIEVLEPGMRPSSLSLDGAWLAYVSQFPGPLTIRELATGEEVTFPLLPDSTRGAGFGVFSADNQYVAWMEAGGFRTDSPPSYHASIRIASTSGELIADVLDTSLPNIAGAGDVWIAPLGWLDARTLLISVRLPAWDSTTVLAMNYDGTAPGHIASGEFVGFLYP